MGNKIEKLVQVLIHMMVLSSLMFVFSVFIFDPQHVSNFKTDKGSLTKKAEIKGDFNLANYEFTRAKSFTSLFQRTQNFCHKFIEIPYSSFDVLSNGKILFDSLSINSFSRNVFYVFISTNAP